MALGYHPSMAHPVPLSFEEALVQHLALRGLLVPRRLDVERGGAITAVVPQRECAPCNSLPGRALGVFEIGADEARQVGAFLADLHLCSRGFRRRRRNDIEPQHVAGVLERCISAVRSSAQVRDVKTLALELVRHHFPAELPRGIIHGNLQVGSVRFAGHQLCGVGDFEFASFGPFAFDLAVALVAWAFSHDGFVRERALALVEGYQSRRPLVPVERGMLYELCRFAVTRLAAARFYEFEARPRRDPGVQYQDYHHYIDRLEALRGIGASGFRNAVFGSYVGRDHAR